MLATKITTHVPDAINRLLSQYVDSPRTAALVAALVGEIQALEDAIYDLDAARSLFGNPVGVQIDKLGELVGVPRNGLSDATYLSVLRGAIAEDYSDGTSATLVNAAAALFQAKAVFRKDVSSVGPWPGLVAVGGSPAINWTLPAGAVTTLTTTPINAGTTGGFFVTAGTGAAFVATSSSWFVLDPLGPSSEVFPLYSTPSGDIISQFVSPYAFGHAAGTLVYYAPDNASLPVNTPAVPPNLAVQGDTGGFSGSVAVGIGSPQIDPADYPVVRQLLLGSVPAGVGLFYISLFNATAAFACVGPQAWVGGWGDANNPAVGAPMADLLYNNPAL